ncbi:MAG: C40 family peptidase [Bacteroidota bacterium]
MKKVILLVVFVSFFSLASRRSSSAGIFYAGPAADSIQAVDSIFISAKADSIVAFAKTLLGTPYKYGSCSPKAFDCSGFVYYVLKNHGIEVPRSSYEMGKAGKEVPLSQCRKGDIILFRGTNARNPRIGHAGLIISEQGQPVQFIHSSSNKKKWGVIISSFDESEYYAKRFVKVVRVLYKKAPGGAFFRNKSILYILLIFPAVT